MIIHAAIYWIVLSPGMPKGLVVALFILQGAILIAISLVALHMVVCMCLYLTLAGVVILSVNQVRHAILAGLCFLIAGIPGYVFYSSYIGIGTVIWFFMPIALFLFTAVMIFAQQMNAKNRTQLLLAELAESHRQLEAYSAEVEKLTLSNERQRMARELHDTLAQGLAGIILQLEAVDSHLDSGRAERAQSIVRQAMLRARATLAESRQVIDRLRSDTSLTPDRLPGLIQDEVERYSNATGIPITLQMDADVMLPGPQGDCVFRAVTEALLNVARYANASQVWITLEASADQVQVEIRDNGSGFDPAGSIGQLGHYGLLGLRERARLLGGSLDVRSAPQQGTCLILWLPIETEVNHDG
jgi:NarL family two-component system sensor histidine kinase YdfH